MVAYFQLQPPETELQQLADEYWQKAGEKEHQLEKAAFEAGDAIRKGDYTPVSYTHLTLPTNREV